jgi:hypothetical protein
VDIAMTEISEETYTRVLMRFEGFWPDWSDDTETADWMASYVRDRVTSLRDPSSVRELKRLQTKLTLQSINAILHQLAGPGRTASAFIGPEDSFE